MTDKKVEYTDNRLQEISREIKDIKNKSIDETKKDSLSDNLETLLRIFSSGLANIPVQQFNMFMTALNSILNSQQLKFIKLNDIEDLVVEQMNHLVFSMAKESIEANKLVLEHQKYKSIVNLISLLPTSIQKKIQSYNAMDTLSELIKRTKEKLSNVIINDDQSLSLNDKITEYETSINTFKSDFELLILIEGYPKDKSFDDFFRIEVIQLETALRDAEGKLTQLKNQVIDQEFQKKLNEYQDLLKAIKKEVNDIKILTIESPLSLTNVRDAIATFKHAEEANGKSYGKSDDKSDGLQVADEKVVKDLCQAKMDSQAAEIKTALIKQKDGLIGLKGVVTPKQFTEFTSFIAEVEKNKALSDKIGLAEFKEASQYIHEQIIGADMKAQLGKYKDARETQYKTKDSLRAGDMLARREFIAELVSDDTYRLGLLTLYQNNPTTPDLKKQLIKKIQEGIVKFPGIEMKTVLSSMLVKLAPTMSEQQVQKKYYNEQENLVKSFEKTLEGSQGVLKSVLTSLNVGTITADEAKVFLHAMVNAQLSSAHQKEASSKYLALNILIGVFTLGIAPGIKAIVEKLSGNRASVFGDRNEEVKQLNKLNKDVDAVIKEIQDPNPNPKFQ